MPALEQDRVTVTSSFAACEMKRLVHVADEMDQETKRDVAC